MGITITSPALAPGPGYLFPTIKPNAGEFVSPWTTNISTASPTLSRVYYHPLIVPIGTAIDRIGTEHTASGAATSVGRLGLYAAGSDGRPGARIVDGGTVDFTVAATNQTVTVSAVTTTAITYIAFAAQATITSLTMRWHFNGLPILPDTTYRTTTTATVFFQDSVTGAFPATATVGGVATSGPRVYVRVA